MSKPLRTDYGYYEGERIGQNIPSDHWPDQPGEFLILGGEDVAKRIIFGCPLRPGEYCTVPLSRPNGYKGAVWNWDGDKEEPTLSPSIHCLTEYEGKPSAGCGWHGHIKKGKPEDA